MTQLLNSSLATPSPRGPGAPADDSAGSTRPTAAASPAPPDGVRCPRCGGVRNAFALVLPLGLGERPWPADCACGGARQGARGACPSEAADIAPSSHPCRRHTDRRVRRLTGRLADLTARWRKTAARAERLRRQIDRAAAEIAALVTAAREERPARPSPAGEERPR